jgi:hypothetical protein
MVKIPLAPARRSQISEAHFWARRAGMIYHEQPDENEEPVIRSEQEIMDLYLKHLRMLRAVAGSIVRRISVTDIIAVKKLGIKRSALYDFIGDKRPPRYETILLIERMIKHFNE